ncbi:MAG: FG-GAP repeat protein, partial [Victivallaceae bacterium]
QRNGSSWNFVQKLTSSDTESTTGFGEKVAIAEDLIVVGTSEWGSNDVYVYRKNGTEWDETKFTPAADTPEDDCVGSVAASGNTFVVGLWDSMGRAFGSALVYHWNGATWDKTQLTGFSNEDDYSGYGRSVSISGNTVVIGEGGNDASGESSGCVYVYNLDFGDTALTVPGSLKQTVTSNTVLFDWSDVSGSTKYDILVDNNADFSSPEFEGLPGTSQASTVLADGTYYWKVQACNASGRSDWASGSSFIIDTTAPSVPATLIRTITANNVAFDWADATDSTSGVKNYLFQ